MRRSGMRRENRRSKEMVVFGKGGVVL